jgi:hypothetical protein
MGRWVDGSMERLEACVSRRAVWKSLVAEVGMSLDTSHILSEARAFAFLINSDLLQLIRHQTSILF